MTVFLSDGCLNECFFLDTERAALNAGTGYILQNWNISFFQYYFYFEVGFDRVIFSGNPTLKDLKNYSIKASPEEQGYLSLDVLYVKLDSKCYFLISFPGQRSQRTL